MAREENQMTVRSSIKYALGVVGALSIASVAMAQTDTSRTTSDQRIRVTKERGGEVVATPRVDTVTVVRNDTVTLRRTDTVMVVQQVLPAPLKRAFGPGFYLGLAGGGAFPQEQLKGPYSAGPYFQGQVGYQGIRIPLGVRADVSYGTMQGNTVSGVQLEDANVLSVTGNATLRIPLWRTSWRPAVYGVAGGGMYRFSNGGGAGGDGMKKDTEWGLNAGGGFELGIGMANVFVEGHYAWVNSDLEAARYAPVVVGVRFF
jgi:hypothetical protein